MRRSGVFVFIAAGLLLVGGAVLWLASGGEADGGSAAMVGELAAGPGDTAPDALPAAWTQDDAPASASLAAVEPEIAAVAVDEVPASYRQALGGLKGRILEHTPDDRETLRPVAGMTVELAGGRASSVLMPHDALLDPAQLEARFLLGSAVTDAEGRFALESIEPRTLGALLLDPGGPRAMFWPLEVTPVSGQASDLGDLVLPETATLVGTVVDEDSQPVAGARVRATDLPLPEAFAGVAEFRQGCGLLFGADMTDGLGDKLVLPPPSLARLESRLPFPTAFTDAEGRFELTGVTPGLVIVVVDDGVHVPLGRSGIATGAAGGRRDVGTLAMSNGLPLAVKVRTSDGQDAPGAEILAGSPLPGAPVGIMKAPRRRAEDGSAQFTGMSDGPGWVGARLDARHDFTVLALPEVAVGEAVITLAVPHTLTLTLLDASGLPIEEGARFFGRALKENQTPDLVMPPIALADRTEGGEKGRWVLSELDPTFWEITTIVPGQPQHRANVDLTAGDATLEVRLPLGHAATVRVVSAAGDTPVEYALVQAFPDEDSLDINLFDGPASRRRTDAQGLAQFTALPGGDITFVVDHPGYAVTELAGRLPADDELRVELSAGGAVAGQVIEQGAPPAEPLLVMMHVEDAPGDGELPRFALSDVEGRFRFDRVEPGEVQLEARSRMEVGSMSLFESLFNSPLAEAETTVTEGATSEVVLEVGANIQDVETGFVSGQLTVNGSPAEGWKIRTWGRIRRSASTDANGRFDLGRIAAGEVELAIAAPSQTMANGYTEQREVQLEAEERLWVPIDLTTGAISGHVRSAATGAPLAGVEVSATDAEPEDGWGRRPETISAADGSFTLEPVVAGRYTLRARADGYAQAGSEPFDVAAFQTKTGLVLRLPKALQVSGTISFEGSGDEPDWIWIMATGGGGGDSRDGAQVDPDDLRFTFDNLGPGEWTFELNTSLEVEFETITRTLTADTQGLKLDFKPLPPDPPDEPEGGQETIEIEVLGEK